MNYISRPQEMKMVTSWCGTRSSGGVACGKDN